MPTDPVDRCDHRFVSLAQHPMTRDEPPLRVQGEFSICESCNALAAVLFDEAAMREGRGPPPYHYTVVLPPDVSPLFRRDVTPEQMVRVLDLPDAYIVISRLWSAQLYQRPELADPILRLMGEPTRPDSHLRQDLRRLAEGVDARHRKREEALRAAAAPDARLRSACEQVLLSAEVLAVLKTDQGRDKARRGHLVPLMQRRFREGLATVESLVDQGHGLRDEQANLLIKAARYESGLSANPIVELLVRTLVGRGFGEVARERAGARLSHPASELWIRVRGDGRGLELDPRIADHRGKVFFSLAEALAAYGVSAARGPYR